MPLIRPSQVFIKYPSRVGVSVVRKRVGGAWVDASIIYKRSAGAWVARYSTPALTYSSLNITKDGSGSSATGRVYSDYAQPSFGKAGTASPNYHYLVSKYDGDASIEIETPSDPNTRFYRDFSSVPAASPSGYEAARFLIQFIDDGTGALWQELLTVNLQWTNLTPAYSPHTDVRTSGSGITIPPGAPSVTITVVGGGGGGGGGAFDIPTGDDFGGNGGGSGGWRSQTYSISPSDYNATINYSIGVGAGQYPAIGGTSSFNGSVTGAGLSATGGTGGLAGKQPLSPGSVGGSPNGVNGTAGGDNFGGSGGNNGKGAGRGGDGSTSGSTSGDSGAVIFQWN